MLILATETNPNWGTPFATVSSIMVPLPYSIYPVDSLGLLEPTAIVLIVIILLSVNYYVYPDS